MAARDPSRRALRASTTSTCPTSSGRRDGSGRTSTRSISRSFVDPLSAAEEKERVEPEGVSVLSLSDALDEHEDLVEEYFGCVIDPEENYLTALSTALFTTGTLVYVPEGVDAEDVTIRTTMKSQSLFNYTLVVTEKSSSVTILERQESEEVEGERYYCGLVEIAAGENSYVQYGSLQDVDEETYNYTLKRGRRRTTPPSTGSRGTSGPDSPSPPSRRSSTAKARRRRPSARSSATTTSTSTSTRASGTTTNTRRPTSSPAASSTTKPARSTRASRTSARTRGTRTPTSVRTR